MKGSRPKTIFRSEPEVTFRREPARGRTRARRLFSNKAKFHPCAPTACAYWTVKVGGKRWKGGRWQGHWVMKRKGRVVNGAMR